ncbi:hypothetical protein V8C86DRAFT_2876188 [Haematococcus lacustris]
MPTTCLPVPPCLCCYPGSPFTHCSIAAAITPPMRSTQDQLTQRCKTTRMTRYCKHEAATGEQLDIHPGPRPRYWSQHHKQVSSINVSVERHYLPEEAALDTSNYDNSKYDAASQENAKAAKLQAIRQQQQRSKERVAEYTRRQRQKAAGHKAYATQLPAPTHQQPQEPGEDLLAVIQGPSEVKFPSESPERRHDIQEPGHTPGATPQQANTLDVSMGGCSTGSAKLQGPGPSTTLLQDEDGLLTELTLSPHMGKAALQRATQVSTPAPSPAAQQALHSTATSFSFSSPSTATATPSQLVSPGRSPAQPAAHEPPTMLTSTSNMDVRLRMLRHRQASCGAASTAGVVDPWPWDPLGSVPLQTRQTHCQGPIGGLWQGCEAEPEAPKVVRITRLQASASVSKHGGSVPGPGDARATPLLWRGRKLPARISLSDLPGLAAAQEKASHMRVQLPPLCACNSGASCYDPHYTTRCTRNCQLYARPDAHAALLTQLLRVADVI